jgi:hypothetical protein
MRTNLVDGLIIGLGISVFVLSARWLFGDTLILWQIAVIGIGAVVLAGLQMVIERIRAARAHRQTMVDPAPDDTTVLHSPRMAWNADPPPSSDQAPSAEELVVAISEPPPAAEPDSPPAAEPLVPPTQILPEATAEHSQEKMV